MVARKLYPLGEAQVLLGISRTELWQRRKDGDVEVVYIGTKPLIPEESINGYIERLRKQAEDGAA